MPSLPAKILEAKPWTNPQFVYNVANHTMQTYYRSQEMDASPNTGFCIPVTPEIRTTASPTGGVVGRYLVNTHRAAVNRRPVPEKPLSMADTDFLLKTLNHQLDAANSASLMSDLVPVHHGRPGEHILRLHERTGQLYACIPANPYAPDVSFGQEYSLPSYDSFFQPMAHPYPAAFRSSLSECNHCRTPTKVLRNDSLCPFHAYYLATGRYVGFYEFCALVELEKAGLSITTGWWSIGDMVIFADALTERIRKWRFLQESTIIPNDSWSTKFSPFGAVGDMIPRHVSGITGSEIGTVRSFQRHHQDLMDLENPDSTVSNRTVDTRF